MRTYHGKTDSSEYKTWNNMLSRCLNANHPRYKDWGGRGITVDPSWMQFVGFYKDMGDRPTPRHTLERRDNAQGYNKNNCYWATTKEQAVNRRSNKRIEYKGVELTIREWADKIGVKPITLSSRLRRGESIESALDGRLHAGFKR